MLDAVFLLFLLMAIDGPNLFMFFKKSSVLQPRVQMECIYHTSQKTRLLIPQICLSIVSKTMSDAELSTKVEILC